MGRVRYDDGSVEGKWVDHDKVPEGVKVMRGRDLTVAERKRRRDLARKRSAVALAKRCAIGFIDERGEPLPEAKELPSDVLEARKRAA